MAIHTSLRIATRKSPLALWQADFVKKALEKTHPGLHVEVIGMMTEGDKQLATPLAEIGGKGLFVKELEKAILGRQADIAVHSMKDMPVELRDGLVIGAMCERDDPRDVFVSRAFNYLEDLPLGAIVGTSSSRRACQLKAFRADLKIETLRGNVGTRLMRLDEGRFDAIILAAAGLKRLNEARRIRSYLPPELWIPAVGQGAIGIECHKENVEVLELIAKLEHMPTRLCVNAERAMNHKLNGGCQLPIAAHASITKAGLLTLRGMVGDSDNNKVIFSTVTGDARDAEMLGIGLAQDLLTQGAAAILKKYTS